MKETWTTYFLYTGSITAWSNWHRARATGGCSNTQCSGNRFVSCLAWFQSPTFSNASHRPNFWFAAYCSIRKQHTIKDHQFVNICSEVEIKKFSKKVTMTFHSQSSHTQQKFKNLHPRNHTPELLQHLSGQTTKSWHNPKLMEGLHY